MLWRLLLSVKTPIHIKMSPVFHLQDSNRALNLNQKSFSNQSHFYEIIYLHLVIKA